MPGLLQGRLLRDLSCAKVSVPCPILPMYMIWHPRHPHDPAHHGLRTELDQAAERLGTATT